ncbi:hypothetical protein M427DRAFT_171296 [Gonapodya prolifera JEL478]|uniref:Uncharacterized protein n=1 Tax=Gonapodya prolifera (strain JEL478) TaxID=1344416 RepID=A0A139B0Z8_GONPJ|nr:hypothetical protein M427DRAFT_171296 [Gonapodya prolifera JEL478]|eukprot:KXS22375.1 hypothetical protein M427DRAFT_171296 [Gonapodya prolifera JEL478]
MAARGPDVSFMYGLMEEEEDFEESPITSSVPKVPMAPSKDLPFPAQPATNYRPQTSEIGSTMSNLEAHAAARAPNGQQELRGPRQPNFQNGQVMDQSSLPNGLSAIVTSSLSSAPKSLHSGPDPQVGFPGSMGMVAHPSSHPGSPTYSAVPSHVGVPPYNMTSPLGSVIPSNPPSQNGAIPPGPAPNPYQSWDPSDTQHTAYTAPLRSYMSPPGVQAHPSPTHTAIVNDGPMLVPSSYGDVESLGSEGSKTGRPSSEHSGPAARSAEGTHGVPSMSASTSSKDGSYFIEATRDADGVLRFLPSPLMPTMETNQTGEVTKSNEPGGNDADREMGTEILGTTSMSAQTQGSPAPEQDGTNSWIPEANGGVQAGATMSGGGIVIPARTATLPTPPDRMTPYTYALSCSLYPLTFNSHAPPSVQVPTNALRQFRKRITEASRTMSQDKPESLVFVKTAEGLIPVLDVGPDSGEKSFGGLFGIGGSKSEEKLSLSPAPAQVPASGERNTGIRRLFGTLRGKPEPKDDKSLSAPGSPGHESRHSRDNSRDMSGGATSPVPSSGSHQGMSLSAPNLATSLGTPVSSFRDLLHLITSVCQKQVGQVYPEAQPVQRDWLILQVMNIAMHEFKAACDQVKAVGAVPPPMDQPGGHGIVVPLASHPEVTGYQALLLPFMVDARGVDVGDGMGVKMADWLRVVFGMDRDAHNETVRVASKKAAKKTVLLDLRARLDNKQLRPGTGFDWAHPTVFTSDDAWQRWVIREEAKVNAWLQNLGNSESVGVLDPLSGPPSSPFIPPDPYVSYRSLVATCVAHDIGMNPVNTLSSLSTQLLTECAERWHIPTSFRNLPRRMKQGRWLQHNRYHYLSR